MFDRVTEVSTTKAGLVRYEYNANDEVTAITYPSGKRAFYEYNSVGRVTSVVEESRKATFAFSRAGDLAAVTTSNGAKAKYTYDRRYAEPSSYEVTNKAGSVLWKQTNSRDDAGTINQIDVSGHTGNARIKANIDDLGRLAGITHDTSAGTPSVPTPTGDITFDTAGRLTSLPGGVTLTYDAKGRLATQATSDQTTTYGFDSAGRRVAVSGQLGSVTESDITAGRASLEGELKQTALGDGDWSHQWDGDDRLTSVESGNERKRGVSYSYGTSGLLASRAVAGEEEKTFTWDRVSSSVPRLLSDGEFEYFYGPYSDVPLWQISTATGDVQFLHTDLDSSVVATTDRDGWQRSFSAYAAFGRSVKGLDGYAHTAAVTRFGFAGEHTDPLTGYVFLRARWYDPATGQFLSVDPLWDVTDSPYGYAAGNPWMFSDPTGLLPCEYTFSCGGLLEDLTTATEATFDNLTMGGTRWARTKLNGGVDPVDTCSSAYRLAYKIAHVPTFLTSFVLAPEMLIVKGIASTGRVMSTSGRLAKLAPKLPSFRPKLGKCNSFDADTPVVMADGTTKTIAQVQLGDQVMAQDPVTGEQVPRDVVDLIRHAGVHTMVRVVLSTGEVIDATAEHPFWDEGDQAWIEAIDLGPGDVLRSGEDATVTVASVRVELENLTAYNLTVDDLHTYQVGDANVLVHNAEECMVRMRHYTRKASVKKIMEEGILRAHDQNKVFMVKAKRKPLPARVAEKKLGIDRGSANAVIEYYVPKSRLFFRKNDQGIEEWYTIGDIAIENAVRVR